MDEAADIVKADSCVSFDAVVCYRLNTSTKEHNASQVRGREKMEETGTSR